MAHECEICGQECYCDMEDHGQPQPDNCVHLRSLGMCVIEADYYEADADELSL